MQKQTWQGHTAQESQKAAWARREESSAALTHRLLFTSSRHCAIFGDREKANYPPKAELESTPRKKRRKPPKMSEEAACNKSTVMIRQEKAVAGSDRTSFVVEASDVRLIPGFRRKELPLGPQGPATNSRGKEHAHRGAKRTKTDHSKHRGFLGPSVILFAAEPLILFRAKLFLQIPATL